MIGGGWGNRADGRGINPSWLLKDLDAVKYNRCLCQSDPFFIVNLLKEIPSFDT